MTRRSPTRQRFDARILPQLDKASRMPQRLGRTLETFANPDPARDFPIHMEIPEFTCLCPKTGQPDFATLYLDYIPDRRCVELKSLKLYVWSYPQRGGVPRGGDEPHPGRSGGGYQTALHAAYGAFLRARRHLHPRRRRAPQARLAATARGRRRYLPRSVAYGTPLSPADGGGVGSPGLVFGDT